MNICVYKIEPPAKQTVYKCGQPEILMSDFAILPMISLSLVSPIDTHKICAICAISFWASKNANA